MRDTLFNHTTELCTSFDYHLDLLAEKIKQPDPDKEEIRELFTEIMTYQEQLERSMSLLQYIKRNLKTKKTQKFLHDIKMHYGE